MTDFPPCGRSSAGARTLRPLRREASPLGWGTWTGRGDVPVGVIAAAILILIVGDARRERYGRVQLAVDERKLVGTLSLTEFGIVSPHRRRIGRDDHSHPIAEGRGRVWLRFGSPVSGCVARAVALFPSSPTSSSSSGTLYAQWAPGVPYRDDRPALGSSVQIRNDDVVGPASS